MFCVAYAEEVAFQTNAPMIVNASEAFRVEFALNAKPDDRSFTLLQNLMNLLLNL